MKVWKNITLKRWIEEIESDNENLDFVRDFLIAKGYNKLIPKSLQDKYQREADIEKYLKNMDKLRQRGILS